ncbi:MAG: carboxy terminal-processing peptidase, partial [Victivallaceae bacterium]
NIISRVTGAIFANNHYRQWKMTNADSPIFMDRYLEILDPNKIFFTADEVKDFKARGQNMVNDLRRGNVKIGFEIYDFFLDRYKYYCDFVNGELEKGFDFSVDESFVPDRRKLSYAANMDELKKIWHQKVKHDMLYFRLMERAKSEEKKVAAEADKSVAQAPETPETLKTQNAAAAPEKIDKPENTETVTSTAADPKKVNAWGAKTPEERIKFRLHDSLVAFQQRSQEDILSLYLRALVSLYGPHSAYRSPSEEEDFKVRMRLSLTGIGATLSTEDGYTKVVQLVKGGPAEKSGKLKEEDRIIAVAQERQEPVDVIDMSLNNVVQLIRGEKGTKVTLTILPAEKGRSAVPEDVEIVRDVVELKESEVSGQVRELKSQDGKKLKIGILDLPSFYMDFDAAFKNDANFKSSTRDTLKVLENFKKEQVDAVVIDIRNNGGGSLVEAITLSGLFIPDGPVVQVRSVDSIAIKNDPDPSISYDGPLVLLTNKMTCSAAEIFAGAMKDYERGLLIGDSRTYGKGTVLDVIELNRLLQKININFPAGSVQFESALFYRVNGESNQVNGVSPHILMPSLTENLELGEIYSDNHLPWDKVKAAAYNKFGPAIDSVVPVLQKNLLERISSDPKWTMMKKNIDLYMKYSKQNEISLNEEKRYQEYLDERKMLEESRKNLGRMELELEENIEVDKDDDQSHRYDNDQIMQETLRVTIDYL